MAKHSIGYFFCLLVGSLLVTSTAFAHGPRLHYVIQIDIGAEDQAFIDNVAEVACKLNTDYAGHVIAMDYTNIDPSKPADIHKVSVICLSKNPFKNRNLIVPIPQGARHDNIWNNLVRDLCPEWLNMKGKVDSYRSKSLDYGIILCRPTP